MNPPPKLCVITGATSGIGRAAALQLAPHGIQLILLGRNRTAGEAIVHTIARRYGPDAARFIRVDLAAPDEVRAVAGDIASAHRQIDILINNAGARYDVYRANSLGAELTFATNHLGHFLLSSLLLKNLLASPAPRIVTVSSSAHWAATSVADWELTRARYDRKRAYAQSKLANVLFSYELARRLEETPACVNAVDPGGVATQLGRNNGIIPWAKHLLYHALKRELTSAQTAARTLTFLATDASAGATGCFYRRCRPVPSSPLSYDRDLAASLWNYSLQRVGLNEKDASAVWPGLKTETIVKVQSR